MTVRVIEETMCDGTKRYYSEFAIGRRFFFFRRWRRTYSSHYGPNVRTAEAALKAGQYAFARWQAETPKSARYIRL